MYNDFFGFKEAPFANSPDPRFLFLCHQQAAMIEQLHNDLNFGNGLAVLTGETGTGKTTLTKVLLNNLGPEFVSGFITYSDSSVIDLLHDICITFGIDYEANFSINQWHHALNQYLVENNKKNIKTLLVIDEAQHLSKEVLDHLRLFINVENEHKKLLTILFIGQPEFEQNIHSWRLRQLSQLVTAHYELLPMDSDEAEQYIRFRLIQAGGSDNLFSKKAIDYIVEQTQGSPRLINMTCDAILKNAFYQGEKKPSWTSVQASSVGVIGNKTGASVSDANALVTKLAIGTMATLLGLTLSFTSSHWMPVIIAPAIASIAQLGDPIDELKEGSPATADQFISLDNEPSSFAESLATLYQLWGYEANPADTFCYKTRSSLFNCVREKSDFATLKRLNVPVVLAFDSPDMPSHAVLYHLTDDTMDILVNGKRYNMSNQWLKDNWQGEYFYIVPSHFNPPLIYGMRGQEVKQLDALLSQVLGDSPNFTDVFDSYLKQKVKAFQIWQKLPVTSIADEATLTRLILLTQSRPKLDEFVAVDDIAPFVSELWIDDVDIKKAQ